MNALACTELSRRGFAVLCMNPRSDNNEALVRFETIPLDVQCRRAISPEAAGNHEDHPLGLERRWRDDDVLRERRRKRPVDLPGPKKLVQCGNELAGLAPADGLILVDAHPGNPVNALRSLNPAVTNESRPDQLDPNLDPFSPKNGYDPNGPSSYSEEFKKRYFKAQADRMNRLIDLAMDRQARMRAGTHLYPDDDAFVVPRGVGARLMQLDLSIHHSTAKPRKLLKNDGTIVTQIVESVRRAAPQLAFENVTFDERHGLPDRQVVPERQRHSGDGLDGRN